MTDQAPELLPCPFCGSPANLRRFAVSKDEHTKISNMVSHIQCVNDECCKVTVDIQHMNEAVAIEAWNTRPTPAERPVPQVREALEECVETLVLMERPAFVDPTYGGEVAALGKRIGFGALMPSASASWREALKAQGFPTGGEFVVGPCFATVLNTLKKARAALTARPSDAAVAWRWKVSPNQLNWVYSESPSPVPQFNVEPLYALPPDEPARVTPSTVGGEAHEETVREVAQLRTQLKIAKAELNFVFVKHGYQSTADALRALSPTIASEKEPVQASIDQRGSDVPGLGRDYR